MDTPVSVQQNLPSAVPAPDASEAATEAASASTQYARRTKPKVHVFGHIHGGAGGLERDGIRFVNAAYLNERYKPKPPAGKIRVLDL